MAKDPSVLFYTSDYLTGTSHFSFAEKGFYMDILCQQQQKGHLSMAFIQRIAGSEFEKLWPAIKEKFLVDSSGNFFNERMDFEIEKRRKYSDSRSNNRKSNISKTHEKDVNNTSGSYVQHMENENENTNENKDKEGVDEKFILPEMLKVFMLAHPTYPESKEHDYPALLKIGEFIKKQNKGHPLNSSKLLSIWDKMAKQISSGWYSQKSLKSISTHIQAIYQETFNPSTNGKSSSNTGKNRKESAVTEAINELRAEVGVDT